ncbi:bifunctional hydroxymethylpyrimidine kinase/phosphomethylpyrimidine kinase [Methanoculleus chikugoensis]|uniref:bifunctional hydroxymethylpyrimidine kinase/phosphomethylpyrimidine kinase n=1 Tax=Methanoculleus chikugoensis TaxID=118126 RepID=UPI001FB3E3A6|nr:bifunctional hydroxymethylpyrimidine kinase/phosphomethylpyrimidine kinase [Methanoculleus chikugoensis]
MRVTTVEEMHEAGQRILDLGARAVVVKGGHLAGGAAVDILVDRDGGLQLSGERYPPYSVHGSGCCFSAALAACLARGGCPWRRGGSARQERSSIRPSGKQREEPGRSGLSTREERFFTGGDEMRFPHYRDHLNFVSTLPPGETCI